LQKLDISTLKIKKIIVSIITFKYFIACVMKSHPRQGIVSTLSIANAICVLFFSASLIKKGKEYGTY